MYIIVLNLKQVGVEASERKLSSYSSKVPFSSLNTNLVVTNGISFHARVGRFSSFLYLRSVALLIPMECGHSSDFVLASPCSPRLPVFLGSPYIS